MLDLAVTLRDLLDVRQFYAYEMNTSFYKNNKTLIFTRNLTSN